MQPADSYAAARTAPSIRTATLAGLMEIYERNYVLLKQLFADHDPGANFGAARAVHYPDGRHRLESLLLKRERYTTVVVLSYSLLDRRGRPLVHPLQLKICVYRDARQAELLGASRTGAGGGKSLKSRWLLNKFLHDVLTRFNRRGACLVRCGDFRREDAAGGVRSERPD